MPVKAKTGGQGRIRTGRPGAQIGSGSTPGSPSGDGGPDFQTNFTAISSLPTGISLTRASTGTYFDASGVLQTAAIDAPRFGHTWNGAAWIAAGLMDEKQRTNLFLQTGSPANQTITVANGTIYTVSFYGTGTLTLSGATTQTMNGSSANVRTAYTFTASTTSLVIVVSGTVTYPNVEAGNFANSHIPTTSAAVTRSADIVNITGSDFTGLYNQPANTFILEFTIEGFEAGGNQYPLGLSDGAGLSNFLGIRMTNTAGLQIPNSTGAGVLTLTVPTVNIPTRIAFAQADNDHSASQDGGAAVTSTATAAMPTLNRLDFNDLGGPSSVYETSIWLRGFAAYKSRLPDAALQAKSVVGAAF
jgi:hypothetical protein